jgi:hypothetical protein
VARGDAVTFEELKAKVAEHCTPTVKFECYLIEGVDEEFGPYKWVDVFRWDYTTRAYSSLRIDPIVMEAILYPDVLVERSVRQMEKAHDRFLAEQS